MGCFGKKENRKRGLPQKKKESKELEGEDPAAAREKKSD